MRVEPKKAEEWEDVDAALFKNTIRTRDRPAVLRGLVRAWPATKAGLESAHSLTAYLKTFDSGHAAPLFEGPASIKGRFFYNDALDGFNFESKRALLGDVLERLCRELKNESAPALYSGSASLPIYFPGFSNANHVRGLMTPESVRESIWIGNRTRIAAHFDNIDNLACVVGGRRSRRARPWRRGLHPRFVVAQCRSARRLQCTRQLLVAGRCRLFRVAVNEPAALPSDHEEPATGAAARLESLVRLFDFPNRGPGPRAPAASGARSLRRVDPGKRRSHPRDSAEELRSQTYLNRQPIH